MNLHVKDMKVVGFKSGNVLLSAWSRFYYKPVPEKLLVYVVDALDEKLMHFKLSKRQYNRFEKGTLCLVPMGCCNPTGKDYLDDPFVDYEGDFKSKFGSKKEFLEYLNTL